MPAITTSVRLFDCKRELFISGQELMAIQGFDLSQMTVPDSSYRLLNLMAGGELGNSFVSTCAPAFAYQAQFQRDAASSV